MSITQDENLMLELYRQARDKGLSNEAALAVVTSQLADFAAKKYRLKISAISHALGTITTGDIDQKALCAVKTAKYRLNYNVFTNVPGHDLILGYLYHSTVIGANNTLYYAPINSNNIATLGTFDVSPSGWVPAIGEAGEIIWVNSNETTLRASRLKPRVHVAGTYSTAPEIAIVGDIPIGWIPSAGIDFARDESGNEYCIFGEYTAVKQGNVYVWKVTKPYNVASNWTKVLTKAQASSAYDTDGDVWHFHSSQHDEYSGAWLITSGDGNALVHVWMSTDKGDTWTEVAGGDQKYRTLNFVFTEDYIYWGVDKASTDHALYRIGRDESGLPDFSTITKLADLPSWQATYATVLMHSPSGLLMLDRVDTDELATAHPVLEVYFWDFKDSRLYKVVEIPNSSEFPNKAFGFRAKCITLAQGMYDTRIIVGFNEYANFMGLPYNENARDATLALELI